MPEPGQLAAARAQVDGAQRGGTERDRLADELARERAQFGVVRDEEQLAPGPGLDLVEERGRRRPARERLADFQDRGWAQRLDHELGRFPRAQPGAAEDDRDLLPALEEGRSGGASLASAALG